MDFKAGIVLSLVVEKVGYDGHVVLNVLAHWYRDWFAALATDDTRSCRPQLPVVVVVLVGCSVVEGRELDARSTGERPLRRRRHRLRCQRSKGRIGRDSRHHEQTDDGDSQSSAT